MSILCVYRQRERIKKMQSEEMLRAIAKDLELCNLGLALTKGKLRKRYVVQRELCIEAIAELNRKDGLDDGMSDDDLLAALYT